MFQPQLVSIVALFASFIPSFAFAAAVSNTVTLVKQHSVSADQTSWVGEGTKSIDEKSVIAQSTPVSAKSILRKMSLFPTEVREEIMSKNWNSSLLATLPVEMLPLLMSVRHVTVDNVTAFGAVFNALQKLHTIDLTAVNWQMTKKLDLMLMVKMLAKIMKHQVELPPTILGLNDLFIAAILKEQYNVMTLLLLTPPLFALINPEEVNNSAFRLASFKGHANIVQLLLEDGRANPATRINEAIRTASQNGHADVVKLLLADPRVNPAADRDYAIRMAAKYGRANVVKLLLADRRVDPSAEKNEAIRMASEFGHFDVVQLLVVDGRADPAAENFVSFCKAKENGHYKVFELLVAYHRVDRALRKNCLCAIL